MTKDEFLQKFQLFNLPLAARKNIQTEITEKALKHSLKPAAVLILLVAENAQLQILLTTRAKHLRHHPGQISFPGGKVEEQDHSLFDTALREAQEEIGIPPKEVTIIGKLAAQVTHSGFIVTPVIGYLNKKPQLRLDKNEVSDCFYVPIQNLIDNKRFTISVLKANTEQHVHFMPYKERPIWGATAAMLNELIEHINR